MKQLIVCMLLAGCSTGDLVPLGTDYVALRSQAEDGGQRVDVIYANDILQVSEQALFGPARNTSSSSMPKGSYETARNLVDRAGIVTPDPECLDGTLNDSVLVSPATKIGAEILSVCTTSEYADLRAQLTALLPPWPRPVAAEDS
jgi:hypothetical protein